MRVKLVLLMGLGAGFLFAATDAWASPFERIANVTSSVNVIGGNAKGGTFAQCPAGTQLVGGGGFFNPPTTNMAIVRSVPNPGANGWEIIGRNWSGTARDLFATAQCGIPKPGGGFASTITEVSSGSFVGNNAQDLEEVGCPAGTQLLSGGGFWEDPNRARVGFVENDARGQWAVIGRNWSGSGLKVFAVSLCGQPGANGGFSEIFNVSSAIPGIADFVAPGQAKISQFFCPNAQVISTGGAWLADSSELGSGHGVALTGFTSIPSSSPEFIASGGNMSNAFLEMVARGRCGT
ncbi:MAG TPA: hypothetical protein VHI77_02805 [Solirubrobacterales bacterium]|jgi:hypothetical protein|nr:hypothetical protein [Solirubrobacterales bacterium]